MPSIRIPRIVRPDVLSNLKSSSIFALLQPFECYFMQRGFALKDIFTDRSALDSLVAIIASPNPSTPPELVEQLELLDLITNPLHGISFEEGYDKLVARLLEADDSQDDLNVKILLQAPEIAWREFDRQALHAKRSLYSYSHNPRLPYFPPDEDSAKKLEACMRPWFETNARSGICSVHIRQDAGNISFIIRHGDLLKRLAVFDDQGRSTSAILRPERVDVAHYRRDSHEWQVSGIGRRLQELYCQAFGAVFHGSAAALVASKRYSLEPLREGSTVLACYAGAPVSYARLSMLRLELPCGQKHTIEKGDIFATLKALDSSLFKDVTLLEAKIELKRQNQRRLVPVMINPSRDKIASPHIDVQIEEWLAERGFTTHHHAGKLLEIT
jgi:hypothetical protein